MKNTTEKKLFKATYRIYHQTADGAIFNEGEKTTHFVASKFEDVQDLLQNYSESYNHGENHVRVGPIKSIVELEETVFVL